MRGVGALNPLSGDEQEPFGPGTPAFMRAYQEAIEAPRRARVAGTLQEIVNAYQRSSAWVSLAPRTKADYTRAIGAIEKKWGAAPLTVIEDPKVRRGLLDWRDALALASPSRCNARRVAHRPGMGTRPGYPVAQPRDPAEESLQGRSIGEAVVAAPHRQHPRSGAPLTFF